MRAVYVDWREIMAGKGVIFAGIVFIYEVRMWSRVIGGIVVNGLIDLFMLEFEGNGKGRDIWEWDNYEDFKGDLF